MLLYTKKGQQGGQLFRFVAPAESAPTQRYKYIPPAGYVEKFGKTTAGKNTPIKRQPPTAVRDNTAQVPIRLKNLQTEEDIAAYKATPEYQADLIRGLKEEAQAKKDAELYNNRTTAQTIGLGLQRPLNVLENPLRILGDVDMALFGTKSEDSIFPTSYEEDIKALKGQQTKSDLATKGLGALMTVGTAGVGAAAQGIPKGKLAEYMAKDMFAMGAGTGKISKNFNSELGALAEFGSQPKLTKNNFLNQTEFNNYVEELKYYNELKDAFVNENLGNYMKQYGPFQAASKIEKDFKELYKLDKPDIPKNKFTSIDQEKLAPVKRPRLKYELDNINKRENIVSSDVKHYKSFDDPNDWANTASDIDYLMEMRGTLNKSLEDIKNMSPAELKKNREIINSKLKNKTLERIFGGTPFTGKEAFKGVSANKKGGILYK